MTLGERIKTLRRSINMSQQELADKLGVAKQTVFKYENGIVTNIPSDKIELMADLFHVTPQHLMGWDTSASPVEETPETKPRGKEDFLLSKFRLLNDAGQDKLLDYANDLVDNERYLKILRNPSPPIKTEYINDQRFQMVGHGATETRQMPHTSEGSIGVEERNNTLSATRFAAKPEPAPRAIKNRSRLLAVLKEDGSEESISEEDAIRLGLVKRNQKKAHQ